MIALIPLWLYLAGILPTLLFAGYVVGMIYVHENYDGEALFIGMVIALLGAGMWPIGLPIYFAYSRGRKVAERERAAAQRNRELDRSAVSEGLTRAPVRWEQGRGWD